MPVNRHTKGTAKKDRRGYKRGGQFMHTPIAATPEVNLPSGVAQDLEQENLLGELGEEETSQENKHLIPRWIYRTPNGELKASFGTSRAAREYCNKNYLPFGAITQEWI